MPSLPSWHSMQGLRRGVLSQLSSLASSNPGVIYGMSESTFAEELEVRSDYVTAMRHGMTWVVWQDLDISLEEAASVMQASCI